MPLLKRRTGSPADEQIDVQVLDADALEAGSGGASRVLGLGVGFVVLCIVCVLLYAVLTGVFAARAPRTLLEAATSRAETAVVDSPGSGLAWSALAASRWAAGDTNGAWDAIEQAKRGVNDHSILYVHTRELDFLLAEGRNEEALTTAIEYVAQEEEYRSAEATANAARQLQAPLGMTNYGETVRLYVLKAAAEGNLEKWEDAIATLTIAVDLQDTASDVLTLRGWAKFRSGDSEGAKADFTEALKYQPDYQSALDGMAAVEAGGQ